MPIRKRYLFGSGATNKKKGSLIKLNPLGNVARRQRKRSLLKIFLSSVLILLFLGFVAGAGVLIYFSKDLPNPASLNKREVSESTKIYDRTGKILLYEIHGEERRTVVPLGDISPYLKNATIAIEDKDFYSHEGVDIKGIVRAVWSDVKAGNMRQGGSTITQQLIKNSILTKEKTFSRKIKEWILSIELEQKFSKDQIIEMYLNQIPYGSNAYGAEAASQTFFKKSAKDLTLGEAAILAALPQAPTFYSPYGTHKENLQKRADTVIEKMEEQKYITAEQAKAAREENAINKITPFKEKMIAPHFVMMVREYLAEKYGDKTLEKGGLRVVTTIDVGKQELAETTLKDSIEKNSKKYNVYNGALVAIDPKTGELLALVGSKDYYATESLPAGCTPGKNCMFEPNVNAAVSSLPPGSSFKPFVYATLFGKGFTPNSILFDVDTEFNASCTPDHKPNAPYVRANDCYDPKNFDGKFRGPVTIRSALAQSLNIPAVKAFYLAGIDKSIETANSFGMTTMSKKDNYGLALVLGGGGVKLLEQTAAYGVFAAEGVKHDLKMVLKVTTSNGSVLEESAADHIGKEVLNKNIAQEISDVLSDNAARTPVFGAASPLYLKDRPVAAKTGTANDYRHAWTMGYTPSLVVGVWAGNNNNDEMNRAGGVSAAAPIWHDFMEKALANTPVEQFNKPNIKTTGKPMLDGNFSGGLSVKIDKACGDKLAKPDTPQDRVEDRTYMAIHNILYFVDPKDPTGLPPAMPESDPQYKNWEAPVEAWADQNNFVNNAPPTEYCDAAVNDWNPDKPQATITYPQEGQTITPTLEQAAAGFNLRIEANIYAPAGVNQANFFFDGNLVGTRSNAPWIVNYVVGKNTADGGHKIAVKVFDKNGNEMKDEVNISLNADFSPPKISLRSPFCSKSFCYLSADASDDKGAINSVEFYYQKAGTNTPTKILGTVSVDNGFYQMMWPVDGMESGSYQVWAKATDNRGNSAVSQTKNAAI